MALSGNQKKAVQKRGGQLDKVKPINAGHMAYHHFFFDGDNDSYFVKAHDPSLFTDPVREFDARHHLKKEAAYYKHLRTKGFRHLPGYANHEESMLLLKALHDTDGWHWEMPSNLSLQKRYVNDIIAALKELESIPAFTYDDKDTQALHIFERDGWSELNKKALIKLIQRGREKWGPIMRADTLAETDEVIKGIRSIVRPRKFTQPQPVLNHHDARQSNIAWHEKHGVAIVDWSWAGQGLENGDTTMFLIDLHKMGYRLDETVLAYFNSDYALRVFAYWLNRSAAEPHQSNDTVRYHQFVSAVKAYNLIVQTSS